MGEPVRGSVGVNVGTAKFAGVVDVPNASANRLRKSENQEYALRPEEAVSHIRFAGLVSNHCAKIIQPIDVGGLSLRKIEGAESTIVQYEAMLDPCRVNVDTNDLATVVDIEGIG